jgi:CubicO group peptidase (beta-lactamase class C family)
MRFLPLQLPDRSEQQQRLGRFAGLLLACLSLLLCAAITASTHAQDSGQAPLLLDDGWEVAPPAEAGFDPVGLQSLSGAIDSGAIRNIHAVLIERDGRLVYERYLSGNDERWGDPIGVVQFDRDTLHDLRSVTKSVVSILLGIALQHDFEAALRQSIVAYFPDLAGRFGSGMEAVTLQHVLTMTAGLQWNEMTVPYTDPRNDEIRLYQTGDPIGMVLGRPVISPPGIHWYYNGGLCQLVAGLVQRRLGERLDAFAEERLFAPLGITHYEWLGSRLWPSAESPSAASGLRLRPRDLAKIGSLFANGGRWQGRQIVPETWVALSTERYVPRIPWSPDGTYGYGFFWYPGQIDGRRVIRAAGNGDQRLFILPELGVVVTVLAGNYNDFEQESGERVLALVLAALQP